LLVKSKEMRPPGRLCCRWKENVKMYLKETGCDVVDWIHLDQERDSWWALVETNESSISIKVRIS
jgi:hypothetical protein